MPTSNQYSNPGNGYRGLIGQSCRKRHGRKYIEQKREENSLNVPVNGEGRSRRRTQKEQDQVCLTYFSIHPSSIHLWATMVTPLSIRPPISSRQYASLLGQRLVAWHKSTRGGKMVADFFGGGVRCGGRGHSTCQVPLGSGDGGYIYQSKQPRGAEYFTCRSGLLHYHVHWSYSIYFKYTPFKIHAKIQYAKWCWCWWWW